MLPSVAREPKSSRSPKHSEHSAEGKVHCRGVRAALLQYITFQEKYATSKWTKNV